MTREERERVINYCEQNLIRIQNSVFACDMNTRIRVHNEKITYITAIDALRGPIPDPETGLVPCGCNWCGQERIGWFSVQFWVRACYGKRKWMSVTQDWKKKVKYCPMCGRKLEAEG